VGVSLVDGLRMGSLCEFEGPAVGWVKVLLVDGLGMGS